MKIDRLANEITKSLSQYTSEIEVDLEKAKIKVSKEGVKILKSTSPKDTGDYAKGWTVKKVGTSRVIHNKTNYQLTHLLENGHAKKSGGRVAPRGHIKPAEEKVIKEFEEEIRRAIK